MGRIARVVAPGLPHHVTQRGVRSMDIFSDDAEREFYLGLLRGQCARRGVEVLAWCLMTNHVHLILVPPEAPALAAAVGEAHRRYTLRKNRAANVRGYLFQGRFSSCVLDERHLRAAARYVELNPVRAGIAAEPGAWPWSSARYHLGRSGSDPLVTDRTLAGLVEAGAWGEFLAAAGGADEETDAALRRATRTGRPAGEEGWLKRLEAKLGRALGRRQAGRPRKEDK